MKKNCYHRFIKVSFWKKDNMYYGQVICFTCNKKLSKVTVSSVPNVTIVFDYKNNNMVLTPTKSKTDFFQKFPKMLDKIDRGRIILTITIYSLIAIIGLNLGLAMWKWFPKFCEKISLLY